jgi:hypothetical protein
MGTIIYPEKRPKEEIQALLWYFLRKIKIDGKKIDARIIKPGVVVFKDFNPVCIVICKSWTVCYTRTHDIRQNNDKQLSDLQTEYNVPVYVCGHMSEIEKIEDIIIKTHYPNKTPKY